MRRRAGGQSIVEMAFVLPVLLIVLFGILEFGYLIFAYSSVSQATRNAAEAAAQLPPYQTWLAYRTNNVLTGNPGYRDDACVNAIYVAAATDQTLFTDITNYISVSYPEDSNNNDTRNLQDRGPIQITIAYPVTGITPLFRLLRIGGNEGRLTMSVTQRRSLENLGVDPQKPGGSACAKDVNDWREKNP